MLSEVGIMEGGSVLDFGCGSGTYSIPAAKLVGKKGKIYALDASKAALENLSRKAEYEGLDNIVTLNSSRNMEIPIDNDTIDHVLLIDVLQEISDKEALMAEIHRLLKPDGLVVVYPMHIDAQEFVKLASDMKFTLKEKIFQEKILVFKKA